MGKGGLRESPVRPACLGHSRIAIPDRGLDAGPSHSHYDVNLTSSSSISIVWGPDWNTGVDNITFEADKRNVPEPASFGLMGLGAAGLLLRRRRA
ncbi:MAG: PEP-CTERM sorting domain-containing protein [Planctomycetota bacterium]|nr:PEP-CTERM sorting domain-containing protein [Planctomycetota bacterium]